MKYISQLHYITQEVESFTHTQLAEFACRGGTDWVQLRVKGKSFAEWLNIAEETKIICNKYGAKLIINDNIFVAKEISADGVHLGKEDMSPKEARKFLGDNFIIGGTANSLEDVKTQMKNRVNYIGLGPYRFTITKEKINHILGLEGIKKIIQKVISFEKYLGYACPLVAIGGIRIEDVKPLFEAGVQGVAVSSGINLADDKVGATRMFINAIKK
ncbi:MAG: thiamine phosphate synthase [Bacteroidota bacterium]